jgi:hypothetical protein
MRPLKPPAGDRPEYRYWLIGPDIRLRDPATVLESHRQPRLPARGHSDYPADQVFNEIVAQFARGSIEPSPSCPPSALDQSPQEVSHATQLCGRPYRWRVSG